MESQTPPFGAAAPPPLHHRQSSSQLKLWLYAVLLLLSLLFLFPYLPTLFSSSARLLRPAGLRRGWDALNLCLVLFAILCGFLGRHQDTDPSPRPTDATAAKNKSGGSPRPVEIPTWLREYGDGLRVPEGATSLARRSSSSYPDLRRLAEEEVTRRKYYDDSDVSSRRRHGRRKPDESGTPAVIPAASAMLVESAVAAGEQRKLLRDGADVGSKSCRLQNNHRSSDEEAGAAKAPSKAVEDEAAVAAMRRKLWGNDVDAEPRSHRRRDQRSPKEYAGAAAAAANPAKMSKTRSSSSYPDLRDVKSWDADRRFEEPEVRRRPHHRRRRSYGGECVGETVTSVDKYVVTPAPRPGPPSTPPPPPPPPPFPTIIKDYKKRTRASATKDIATALATFYGKKSLKKQKSKIAHSPDTGLLPSSAPPPPPLPPTPPPRPTFFSLLSSKKKKLHSPPPPPASPPPPRKPHAAVRPPTKNPVDGPFAIGEGYLSSSAQSPLVPIAPPPPPPFRMEKMRFKAIGGFVRVASGFSDVSDSDTGNVSDVDPAGSRTVSTFCPSPSVDMKADTFIARTRAGFRMEKMNSIKERQVEGGPARGRYI